MSTIPSHTGLYSIVSSETTTASQNPAMAMMYFAMPTNVLSNGEGMCPWPEVRAGNGNSIVWGNGGRESS